MRITVWSVWSLDIFLAPPHPQGIVIKKWREKKKQWKVEGNIFITSTKLTLSSSLVDSRMLPLGLSLRVRKGSNCQAVLIFVFSWRISVLEGCTSRQWTSPSISLQWVTWWIRKCHRQWSRYPTFTLFWTKRKGSKPTCIGFLLLNKYGAKEFTYFCLGPMKWLLLLLHREENNLSSKFNQVA